MASVYAASSIHSKSTLSKKYEVDTSAMWNGGEQFRIRMDDDIETTSFITFMQQFSLDVGRFNEVPAWVNTLREFIFPFFLVLNSCGLILVDKASPSLFSTVINVLKRFTAIIEAGTDINISITFNISLLFFYFSFIYSLVINIYQYKLGSAPSMISIYLWLILSRIVAPVLSSYIFYYFSINLCTVIVKYNTDALINLIISIPLVVIQAFYLFFSCSVYNATPIIRSNDSSQLWFSHSLTDWRLNIVLFVIVTLESALSFVKSPLKESIFAGVIIILAVMFTVLMSSSLPYIVPKTNSIMIASAIGAIPFAFFPLINNLAPKAGFLYFIACIAFLIVSYFISKCIVTKRVSSIIIHFNEMRKEGEGEDGGKLDPLSAAIMHLNKTRNNDFYKLGISGEKKLSLYLRVGFLFNVPEVEDQTFIKWCTDQTIKADVLLSACQVSYALQTDTRMLNNLVQYVNKLSSGPYNSKSFSILFDYLRQEMLTQVNTPLLNAVQQAKKADFALQASCSEYWNATLKQKITNMETLIPQISFEMIKADSLFQRLLRNYPKSSTAIKECVISYHKSLGDHHKTMELQAKLNRTKKDGDFDSDGSTSDLDGIDRSFQNQMDPWITAQDIISNVSSPAKQLVIVTSIITLIVMILIPIVELYFSFTVINDYLSLTEPMQVVGNIQQAVSRIPQLIRRVTFIQNEEIVKDMSEAGAIRGTIAEFANESSAKHYIKYYVSMLECNIDKFLSLCDFCSSKDIEIETDNSKVKTTLYDALSTFLLYAREQSNSNDYRNTKNNENVKYLFNNFDSLQSKLADALLTISDTVIDYQDYFSSLSIIFYITTFASPIIIIIPLIIASYFVSRNEIIFGIKLFLGIPRAEISNLKWSSKSKKNKVVKQKDVIADDTSIESMQLKQEELYENLASTPKNHTGIFFGWIGCAVLFVIFSCLFTAIGTIVFSTSTKQLIEISDNYIYSIQASTSSVSCYVWAQELFSKDPILSNLDEMRNKSMKYITSFINIFNALLYGKENQTITPGLLLGSDVIETYVKSSEISKDALRAQPVYGIIHDVYYSMSCESQVRLLNNIVGWFLDNEDPITFSFEDIFAYHFEHIIFAHIQPFLNKGRDMFSNKVIKLKETKSNRLLIVNIVLFVSQLIFIYLFFAEQISLLLHHIKTPKKLLQLVPPESLTKSPTITKFLGGSISTTMNLMSHGKGSLNSEAAEFASDYTDSGVALLDEYLQVTKFNETFKKISKIESLGVPIRNVLQKMLVDNNKISSIQRLEKEAKKMTRGVSKDSNFSFESKTTNENGEMLTIKITLHGHSDNDEEFGEGLSVATSFAIVIEDKTYENAQEEMIKVEDEKIQNLLRLLMPDEIKARHDSDTSIQVDTATIIVAAIKTTITNEEIVGVVNSFFATFDAAMTTDTIKIRTCNLYYIAATGLFDKTRATGQSSADVALKMLQNAKKAAGEREDVSVSIGLYTGNVKCGMIGGTDQVFDIVGETAQNALRLADVCPNWLIHISERTYEEIKFLKYNLKETGNNSRTYLLSSTPFQSSPQKKVEEEN